MRTETQSTSTRLKIPVAVVLEKREIKGAFWSQPAWELNAVLPGEHLGAKDARGVKTGSNEQAELYLWTGYQVTLYRDACERYWHALIGDKPLVYVVCREDETEGSVAPALVTLDYDEASAYGETDGTVLSTVIPPELYQKMEMFVLEHYKPKQFHKRKRKNWSQSPTPDSEEPRRE